MRSANGHSDVDLLRVRAQCLLAMGEMDSAFKHLQQAMKADPDNTTVRSIYRSVKDLQERKQIGDDAFARGRWQEAYTSWSECINLAKESPSFLAKLYLNRGIALSKQKKQEDAIKDYTKAIYYNDEYLKAYIKRSEAYLAIGGPEKIQRGIE
jgi:DnaJ homolog subfamily C member 7